jgi:hypothetical protein
MDQVRMEAAVLAGGGSLGEALRVAEDWARSGEEVALEIVANYRADVLDGAAGLAVLLDDAKTLGRGMTDTELGVLAAACQTMTIRLRQYFAVREAVERARATAA